MLAYTTLALLADAGRGDQDPGLGLGLGLIAAVIVAVVVLAVAGFWLVHRLTRASRGGVQPRRREFRGGTPPLESLARRRKPR